MIRRARSPWGSCEPLRRDAREPAGTLAIPEGIGSASRGLQRTIGPVGIFGPEGFLAVAVYEPFSGRGKAQIRVALLPLRG